MNAITTLEHNVAQSLQSNCKTTGHWVIRQVRAQVANLDPVFSKHYVFQLKSGIGRGITYIPAMAMLILHDNSNITDTIYINETRQQFGLTVAMEAHS